MLIRYVIALTNLYGIVHKGLVFEIYNQQNTEPVSARQVVSLMQNSPKELDNHFIESYGDYFVSSSVLDFDEFNDLLMKKTKRPYYRPEQTELLKYEDDNYYNPYPAPWSTLPETFPEGSRKHLRQVDRFEEYF